MCNSKILPARFFETEASGRMPVREWLLELPPEDRRIRVNLSGGRIARVFFCALEGNLVLLHGFIKKSQKIPDHEMAVAVKRMKGLKP